MQSHEQKIAEKLKLIKKLKRMINEKIIENDELSTHLTKLESAVNERQHIFEIQSSQRSVDAGSGTRMKKIMDRRKLLAKINEQKEELEELEIEMSLLHKKTYPFLP